MTHAERCPVCSGSGKIENYCNNYSTSGIKLPQPCHGCGGKGWITVEDLYGGYTQNQNNK